VDNVDMSVLREELHRLQAENEMLKDVVYRVRRVAQEFENPDDWAAINEAVYGKVEGDD
jgi:hypothetical protein